MRSSPARSPLTQGQTPVGSTPQELTAMLKRETSISELIKQSGATVE